MTAAPTAHCRDPLEATIDTDRTGAVIVLAGGSGTRVGAGTNKVYLPLAGRPMISWSLAAFAGLPGIGAVVLVVRAQDRNLAQRVRDAEPDGSAVEIVDGGTTRQESELCGLRHLAARIGAGRVDTVLVHDGARPLVGRDLASEVLRVARETGGAVPGLRCDDLVAFGGGQAVGPAPAGLVAMQTPQGFRAAPLLAAYEEADRRCFAGTDTASCVERFSDLTVRWIPGDPRNVKITYPHDLAVAAGILAARR